MPYNRSVMRLLLPTALFAFSILSAFASAGHEKDTHAGHPESVPGLAPRPDSAFNHASAWDGDTAETLRYSVKRHGPDGDMDALGEIRTERRFLSAGGRTDPKAVDREALEILETTLSLNWNQDDSPYSRRTVVKLPRRGAMRLLRQDQSLQGRGGTSYRILDCGAGPPRLRVVSSGSEPSVDTALGQWPLYTEEMLFTYLRAVPQRAGYREEVWLLGENSRGRLADRAGFAAITVRGKSAGIRDMDTWYVTVDRENGRRSEFWISAAGLHPVVMAILADRSEWTLREISRRKR